MLLAVLFAIIKRDWKPPEGASVDGWINKIYGIYIKCNAIQPQRVRKTIP